MVGSEGVAWSGELFGTHPSTRKVKGGLRKVKGGMGKVKGGLRKLKGGL